MYNRKTITYKIYEPPRKVLQNAGAQAFRGFVGGDVRYSLCLFREQRKTSYYSFLGVYNKEGVQGFIDRQFMVPEYFYFLCQ
jgi:hypothetical protein